MRVEAWKNSSERQNKPYRRANRIAQVARCRQVIVGDLVLHIPERHADHLVVMLGAKHDQAGNLELAGQCRRGKARHPPNVMPPDER